MLLCWCCWSLGSNSRNSLNNNPRNKNWEEVVAGAVMLTQLPALNSADG